MRCRDDSIKLNVNDYNVEEYKEVKSSIDCGPFLTLDKITIFYVDELINESYSNMEYVGNTIERKAKELIKEYKFNIQVVNFYAYLMREIMRNVVEHSCASELKLFLYSNNLKEFAFKVIDEGIGIKRSLNTNPNYNVTDDQTALAFCVRPGITRSYKKDPARDEVWQNSGFGLYMVSSIIKEIGRFEIASGNRKLIIRSGYPEYKVCKNKGTEVTAVINMNIKINIPETIKRVSLEGNNCANNSPQFAKYAKVKTASKASTLLKYK